MRDEYHDGMAERWRTYDDDPSGKAAQEVLDSLRAEHQADVLDLYDKYRVEPPGGCGNRGACRGGSGTQGGGGGGGGLRRGAGST